MESTCNSTHQFQCPIGQGELHTTKKPWKFSKFFYHRFKTFAKLDKKSDENLSDYYKVFIAMCKRQAGEKLLEEERGLEGLIDEIGEDHAKLILDRLELLSKLREIAKHPKLEERLKLCENNLDTPDWWEPGKHDRELVRAVLKYGLYRSDQYILNDSDFPFAESERHYVRSLEVLKSFKFDNPADLFKLAMGEIPTPAKAETKQEIFSPVKSDKPETEKESEKVVEEPVVKEEEPVEPAEVAAPTAKEEELEEAVKSPEKSSDKEIEKADSEVPPTEDDPKSSKPEAKAVDEVVEKTDDNSEVKKIETEAALEENTPKTLTENPMEVDIEKPPSTPPAAETQIEEEKEDKKEEIKEPESVLPEEKMEVTEETPKADPEVPAETEKDEIVQTEEAEPKIDEVNDLSVERVKLSPEKVQEEAETEKLDNTPVEIKQEPGLERPEGEHKIIDTVVIEDDDTSSEKPTEVTSNQADELRARFPDLEVFQPLMKLKQLDAMMMKGDVKDNLKSLSRVFDTSMVVKWFRDFALEKRISHIIYCVEKGVWPVGKSYSAYSGCMGIDLDLPLYETVKRINTLDDKRSSSSTPDIITITTDHHQMGKSSLSAALQSQLHQSMNAMASKGKKGQKRHIAIDVETERAKLHALLNNTTPLGGQKSSWNEDDQEIVRRSSGGQGLQPPPAHQPSSRSSMSQYKPTVTIPGTSSTLTPIDLSSR